MVKTILVIDSSVIVKWLSQDNENNLDKADKIIKDAQNDKVILITTELAKYEIGNVLIFSKKLSPEQAAPILERFFSLPINFVILSEELARSTCEISFSSEITYYDASFLSLAKQYDAILVTDNIKDQGKQSDIKVISLKDY